MWGYAEGNLGAIAVVVGAIVIAAVAYVVARIVGRSKKK
jgi:hypothetical protein